MATEKNGWNPQQPGYILLHQLRSEIQGNGTLSTDRIGEIALQFGTTPSKVRGAIGYYSELKQENHTVRVCIGESCRSKGSQNTISLLENEGEVVGTLHCAGLCPTGVAVLYDDKANNCKSQTGDGLDLYLSSDSASVAIGSEDIAEEIIVNELDNLSLTRTGSRGLYHLEPMLEVDIEGLRHAFGPLEPSDVKDVLNTIIDGNLHSHSLYLGEIDKHPEMLNQQRFAMARLGVCDPTNLESQQALGAYAGLSKAESNGPDAVLTALESAGLRGRGGAGFPTHFKWAAAARESDPIKHVVANADEGDAGTFIDRMIMEGDPHSLIEGMVICALTIGATDGWVYLRSEYPDAKRTLQSAIDSARDAGILGPNFDITIAVGAGSYVCGEETALLESLEGKRGEVRARPPYPAQEGLYGHPTIVNNVLTFSLVSSIMREGGDTYGAIGTESSKGTVVAQLVGDTQKPTCVEVPFGGTVKELFDNHSSLEGVTAVQVGGPLGSVFKAEELANIELSFEGLTAAGGLLGHGGFVCYGSDFDPRSEVIDWMTFFRDESCGKCTPCRIGTQRALELLLRIGTDEEKPGDRDLLDDLDDVMTSTSLCALGGLAMNPVRSSMTRWPDAFGGELNE